MGNWKDKLTAWDSELFVMVESLTGRPCEPKEGKDCYTIEADYTDHNDRNFVQALQCAVEGRLGNRVIEVIDNPGCQLLYFRIKFHASKYPAVQYRETPEKESPISGNTYCHKLEEIKAVQVTRDNLEKLTLFIGNGEMEIPEDKPVTFKFLNASGSVWAHANESDYIVYQRPGLFTVIPKQDFESEYEPK